MATISSEMSELRFAPLDDGKLTVSIEANGLRDTIWFIGNTLQIRHEPTINPGEPRPKTITVNGTIIQIPWAVGPPVRANSRVLLRTLFYPSCRRIRDSWSCSKTRRIPATFPAQLASSNL